ncbi:phage tail protein [Microvirga sp. TS319]|uniref:phage tail protein n=1 Tax=Microvirga sp. TS319 TaxID=3241165 RepID=UPI00351A9B46
MALDPAYFFYSDGTITLTNGSDIATGDMVAWDVAVLPFDFIFPNDGMDGMSVIKEVLSVNQIRLAKPWTGPTLTDVPYFMLRWARHTDPKVYAVRVSEYLTRLKAIPDNLEEVAGEIKADRQAVDDALAALQLIEQSVDADRQAVDTAAGQVEQARQDVNGKTTLAAAWAQAPKDTDVNGPGTRSALHYAAKAQDILDQVQAGSVPDNAVSTVKIQNKAVTNAKMADMAANTIKGTDTAGPSKDLTAAQVAGILAEYVFQPGDFKFSTRATTPAGFLRANGAAISRTTYAALWAHAQASGLLAATEVAKLPGGYGPGDGATTFTIPDLRGEFIRGFDDGRGIDPGRVLGSWQADDFLAHSHLVVGVYSAGGGGTDNWTSGTPTQNKAPRNTGITGGAETRPRNVAYHWFIKY